MNKATSVTDALMSRRAVRFFRDDPVDPNILRRVLETAARAPSGGNLQPWHIFALAGEALEALRDAMTDATARSPRGEGQEYDIYPGDLGQPYSDRRQSVGEAMYGALGIARDQREERRAWFSRNFRFFDAPVGLFCFVDRQMGPPQWSDLGMYLQSVMLLLREAGLDSCPQECWALYPKTVAKLVGAESNLMLFCGMAIGYAAVEHPVNRFAVDRACLEDFARFEGFS